MPLLPEVPMNTLPDPRTSGPDPANPLVALALDRAAGDELVQAMTSALRAGDDAAIARALDRSGGGGVLQRLSRALDAALEPGNEPGPVMRFFAMPVLFVAGGRETVIHGVVPDVGKVQRVFEEHRALGESKNFGLGNALVGASQLAGVKPSLLFRRAGQAEAGGYLPLDFRPDDIRVASKEEGVHLRFLVGASILPAHAPGITETAGNIGSWGMPMTRLLAEQFGQEGLSLLPIPRPPMSLRRALAAGRFAERELGFQLFLSAALRNFRSRVGEPDATVASNADRSLRIRLASPFDASLDHEYRWPLESGDDFGAVKASLFGLLEECRVVRVHVVEDLQTSEAAH
jgi:hypothetical protein